MPRAGRLLRAKSYNYLMTVACGYDICVNRRSLGDSVLAHLLSEPLQKGCAVHSDNILCGRLRGWAELAVRPFACLYAPEWILGGRPGGTQQRWYHWNTQHL